MSKNDHNRGRHQKRDANGHFASETQGKNCYMQADAEKARKMQKLPEKPNALVSR